MEFREELLDKLITIVIHSSCAAVAFLFSKPGEISKDIIKAFSSIDLEGNTCYDEINPLMDIQ